MSLTNKVEQFNNDSDLVHAFAHGDKNTVIQTEGGPVPSVGRLADAVQTRLNETIEQQRVLEQRLAADSGAGLVKASSGRTVQEELNTKASRNGDSAQDFYARTFQTAGANSLTLTGAASGAPSLLTAGPGADIGMYFGAKGGGRFDFFNGAGRQLQVGGYTASAALVNFYRIYGAPAGGNPTVTAEGSDTNVGFDFTAKGAAHFVYRSNGGIQFVIDGGVVSPANYVRVLGGAAGAGPVIAVGGSDANANLNIQSRGTGVIGLQTGGTNTLVLGNVPSSVNYLQIDPAVAGAAPVLRAVGASTNTDLNLNAKGSGVVRPGSDLRTANNIIIDAAGGERRLQFTTTGGTLAYLFARNLDGAVGLYDATGGNNVTAYTYTPSTKVLALGGGGVAVTVPAPAVGDNSSRAVPASWVNAAIAAMSPSSGGGRVLLAEFTVSTAALYVDILNFVTADYESYDIEGRNFRNLTGGSAPRIDLMIGSTPITAGYVYNSPGDSVPSGTGSNIILSLAGANSLLQPGFNLRLCNLQASQVFWVSDSVTIAASDNMPQFWQASGMLSGQAAGVVTGIRFRWSSTHNTSAGTFRVYGIKKS